MSGAGGEAGMGGVPMPFGSLSVGGDVEEWMEDPFVPVSGDFATGKVDMAFWNVEAPERNLLFVGTEPTTGSASVGFAAFVEGGHPERFRCQPCDDVVQIDMEARSMTFDGFRVHAVDSGAEIFLTGMLYFE